MKTIPIALAAHYALPTTTLCQCLDLTLRDGTVIRATTLDRELTVAGNIYAPWLDISTLVSTASLAVDNLELTVVTDEADLQQDLEAGRYDNAAFLLFEVNYVAPADGINELKRGTTGEAQISDTGKYTLEFRGLTQALQQLVGIVSSRTCRANFADYPTMALASPCGLSPSDWIVAGSFTSVASRQQATDSARTEDDDWFGDGVLTIVSGLNAGYARQVRDFQDGEFTFTLPFPFDIEVGDEYSAIAGCRKRHDRTTNNPGGVSDCIDKFDNVLNFQGEPHLQGIDALTKVPGQGS